MRHWILLAASGLIAGDTIETRTRGQVTRYETRTLEGFTVHVDASLLAEDSAPERELGDRALDLLRIQLWQIGRRVRPGPLAELRAIPLWLSRDDAVAPCACYHVSPEWLRDHGFDPQKAKGVEIARAATFVEWTREQPWMVLHELVHGWFDRHLPPESALGQEFRALFEQAKAAGRYEAVLHWNGTTTRHYALNNPDEFLAEAAEAWFGTNDFFPFVQAELATFDPPTAAFLRKIWGEPLTSRG